MKTTGGRFQFEGGHYELFDLNNDPFESQNLASSNTDDLKRMMDGLIHELESASALYPVDAAGDELKPLFR